MCTGSASTLHHYNSESNSSDNCKPSLATGNNTGNVLNVHNPQLPAAANSIFMRRATSETGQSQDIYRLCMPCCSDMYYSYHGIRICHGVFWCDIHAMPCHLWFVIEAHVHLLVSLGHACTSASCVCACMHVNVCTHGTWVFSMLCVISDLIMHVARRTCTHYKLLAYVICDCCTCRYQSVYIFVCLGLCQFCNCLLHVCQELSIYFLSVCLSVRFNNLISHVSSHVFMIPVLYVR